ncbi:MAG: bis-aminopropyl spermidine synthase family protein [Bacillota bacterium]
MPGLFEKIALLTRLEDGPAAVEKILLSVYFEEGISTKALAQNAFLPLPVVAAVKKELEKTGLLAQEHGSRLTEAGRKFTAETLGYAGLNRILYKTLMRLNLSVFDPGTVSGADTVRLILADRPRVDVTLDQSKGTPSTSIKRALLCLHHYSLIGKEILCLGDDDLVSVALGILLKELFPDNKIKTRIHVIDIDPRFLAYIEKTAGAEKLPITCHEHDLREPIPGNLQNRFDCFFTDPPYTIPGLDLFLTRGVSALKKQTGLTVFLSFAHKAPGFTLKMHQAILDAGFAVHEIIPRFNEYEGAEIIGNTGQMIVLKTAGHTASLPEGKYTGPLYTGELRKTLRTYQCTTCGARYKVGMDCDFNTVEELKEKTCPACRGATFELILRDIIKQEGGRM